MKKRTQKEFIEICSKVHNYKYDYSKVEYTKKDNQVIIICPVHGEFKQIAHSHIRGVGCKKCSKIGLPIKNQKTFIDELNKKHNFKYDYSQVKYTGKDNKIDIICLTHGIFSQIANNHLRGANCPKCGLITQTNKKQKKINIFIDEANIIHNNKYIYDNVLYINSHTNISITCKIHGDFYQKPYSHLIGQGCPECANTLKRLNAPSWTKTNWINAAKNSKDFDGFKLYVIRCFSQEENFIKIGRTYNTINQRFSGNQLPYQYEIIKIIKSYDGEYIYDLENRVKRIFKSYKYIPKLNFGGMYECFKKI